MTRWQRIFYWGAIVNFALFVAATIILGGDALNGRIEDGHYFLGDHGQYTEVSPAIYWYSAIHAGTVLLTLPIVAIMALSTRAYVRRR